METAKRVRGKPDSLFARSGQEARRVAQRNLIRAALFAAQGHCETAARAIGVRKEALSQTAADAGFSAEEWEALKAEAKEHGKPTGTDD